MSLSTYTADSTKILHTTYADFVSRQIGRPVHVVQYDDELPILAVKLFADGVSYTVPTNADVNIKLGKADGTFVWNQALGCDSSRSTVYFEITYQMVVLAGEVNPVVEVVIDEAISASSPICIIIDRNPVQDTEVESTSEWKAIQDAVEYAKEAVASAASASASRSAAAISETNAASSANNASSSATSAKTSADNAAASATSASSSATSAKTSADNAAASATSASSSANNALSSATSAKTSETNASNSETRAEVSASAASTSEVNAKESETNAELSEANAKTSAYNADLYSQLSKSYAVGNSTVNLGTNEDPLSTDHDEMIQLFGREGEDTDNAKYYSEVAKEAANGIQEAETNAAASAASAAVSETNAASSAANAAASETNAATSEVNTKTSETNAASSAQSAAVSEANAKTSETNAAVSETNAASSAANAAASAEGIEEAKTNAAASAASAQEYQTLAKSYAVGGTSTREGEDTDNAKHYYQQVKQISSGLNGALLPMGTIVFSDLAKQTKTSGYMYNISNAFVSDDTFKDGGNISYPAGTNVYYTGDGYWDCLAGSLVSGVKGAAESEYRQGNVNLTPEDIGVYDKSSVDQLIETLTNTITELTNTVDSLTEQIQTLGDLSAYSMLADYDGYHLVTGNDEMILVRN